MLDPQVAAHYNGQKQVNVVGVLPIENVRMFADMKYNDKKHLIDLPKVEDDTIDAGDHRIPIRIYTPVLTGEKLPVMLFFHGGGFVMHNIASHDNLCRKLAGEMNWIVVSVGYRLAPEHKYPAAMEDAAASLSWLAQKENLDRLGADGSRIIVGGDSAGASISAALTFYTRDHHGPKIYRQILFYGSYGCLSLEESESVRLFANGDYVLPMDMILACDRFYIKDGQDLTDPYLYPGKCSDMKIDTETFIFSAECDPLRDDGMAFADKLRQAGSPCKSYLIKGMMHGFMLLWDKFDRTQEVFDILHSET